ncbi:MAG: VCBS repeat-containing protein [bacterium]|nr:VCBS repeat-containing protein [bacterium]
MVTLVLCLFLVVSGLLGCGGGGGASGADPAAAAAAAIAVNPVHLAPGQTTAQLSWAASEGPVENYLIFESRNGSGYQFSQIAAGPTVGITGAPGDSVQITVIGVSPNGEVSESSPPSPPLFFHAAAAPVTALAIPSGAAPVATTPDAETTTTDTADNTTEPTEPTEPTESSESAGTANPTDGADTQDDEENATSLLTRALRELLLDADTRLPGSGLSAEANHWLQTQVDREIAAGVSLVGTGRRNEDTLHDLVWRDPAGQLFISDGQSFLDSEDLPSTFEETLRLRATERFLGLADFEGDGRGDWLIEDTATGDLWVIEGETGQSMPALGLDAESQFAGHGDFDGDGRMELLWFGANDRLQIARPDGDAPSLDPMASVPDGFSLLAVDDLDGNGRDDLLGLASDGTLVIAFAVESGGADSDDLVLEWQNGPSDSTDGLDLIATLDLDGDGAAEIAWLRGDTLEIWSAESGLLSTLDL